MKPHGTKYKLVALKIQEQWLAEIDHHVRMLDTDRSKFIRNAVREKLLRDKTLISKHA